MREIKFRAWEKRLKEMIPVHDIDFDKGMINTTVLWRLFNEVELMQYTGLKDIYGNEIYEGDILNYGYIVTYVDGSKGEDLGMNIGFYVQRDDFESWAMLKCGGQYKVIGNIYENPNLIEVDNT